MYKYFDRKHFVNLKFFSLFIFSIIPFIGCGKSLEPENVDRHYGDEPLLFPEENGVQFSSIGNITVDHRLNESHRLLFLKDIRHLQSLQLDPALPSSAKLLSMMQTSDLQGSTLFHWLEERFQLVLSPTTYVPPVNDAYAANFFLGTNASNYATFSNSTGFLMNLIPGQRYPGIIAVYPLLMENHQKDVRRIEISRSLIRLATYFHEARHSDGNNTSSRFSHQYCPMGHEHENIEACDQFSNGSTAIQYNFLLSALNSCKDCTTVGKNVVQIAQMDFYFRHHLGNGITLPLGDPTPEKVR